MLHTLGHAIGIVTTIRGNCRYSDVKILGQAGHSGTTPMEGRRDAVMTFSEWMYRMRQAAHNYPAVVMTCGIVGTVPEKHAMSVIPDEVRFKFEFRSSSLPELFAFDNMFHEVSRSLRYGCSAISFGEKRITPPVMLDVNLTMKLQMIASRYTATPQLPSGAGHDAAVFQEHGIPTGMIFVRNEHGSHNPQEAMTVEDLLVATNVLRDAMCE